MSYIIKYIIILILALSCGKSDVDVSDSRHTIDGTAEAFTYVIVQFEFIKDIKELCTDLYVIEDITGEEKKVKVAECTFDYLSILDIALVTEFTNDYCADEELYNSLNDIDKARVDELCNIL